MPSVETPKIVEEMTHEGAIVIDYVGKILKYFKDYKIIVIEGAELTLLSISMALCLFYISLKIARVLSKAIRRRLVQIVHLERNTADALETISYYIFLVIATLIALDIAHVPLTVFTLLG